MLHAAHPSLLRASATNRLKSRDAPPSRRDIYRVAARGVGEMRRNALVFADAEIDRRLAKSAAQLRILSAT